MFSTLRKGDHRIEAREPIRNHEITWNHADQNTMRKPGDQEQDELQWRLVPLTQRFPGFLIIQ